MNNSKKTDILREEKSKQQKVLLKVAEKNMRLCYDFWFLSIS